MGGRPAVRGKRTYGGRPGQRVEEHGTWALRTRKHSEAGYGRPVDSGAWTAKTVKRPRQQPAHPQYANYWAPLTRRRHTMPHSAQPRHTNYWAPRTRKRHQQEHRPQRPTESSNPMQHAKGRTGECPGPRKGATTRRNVTQGIFHGGNISLWEFSYFKCVRNFLLNFQATVRNKTGAKFSHWGAFSLPLCSLAVECGKRMEVALGFRTPSLAGGCLYARSPRGRPREGERLRGIKD